MSGPRPTEDASDADRAGPTRRRLRDAALATVRERGIAGVSARTVAARAEVNQASIYYHFGSLHGLLADASLRATEARVAAYRPEFAATTSVAELVDLARSIHAQEQQRGNVAVLAQMLAGARAEPRLQEATAAAVHLWVVEVEGTLDRLLAGTAVHGLLDTETLARALSAAFVGTELLDGVSDDASALPTLDALEQLAGLVEVVLELGPVASGVLRRWLERRTSR